MKVELHVPLSPAECAELAGTSYWTILRRIREGDLRAYKPPGSQQYVVNPEDFRDWLYGTPVEPAAPQPADSARPARSSGRQAAGSLARLKAIERGSS